MSKIKEELVGYGKKIAAANLVAGAGGNISVREGDIVWMKPSGFAMDDMGPNDLCGMDLETEKQVIGKSKPTSEVNMHLGIYKMRPDVKAIFHCHSPWASGVISSKGGAKLGPMFAEFVVDLGRVGTVPYITPTTQDLADAMAKSAKNHDTIFMVNHGVLAVGVNMKQAYFRLVVVEDAAKSLVAACSVGKPIFLTKKQEKDILSLDRCQHRIRMMEKDGSGKKK
jgi:L-fuculose-phosphate aldolase